jgi:putative transposase
MAPRARRSFSAEFKAETIELIRTSGKTIGQVCRDLDLTETAVRRWVQQAEIDAGKRPGLTTAERAELAELRRENRILREEREILKSRGLLREGDDAVSRYRFTASEKAGHSVVRLCRLLRVAPSGYYAWKKRAPSGRALANAALAARIRAVHERSRGTYGSPRVHAELRAAGPVGRKRVARLMREAGLAGCRPRGFRRTTTPDPTAQADDLVRRDFRPAAPDRLWVADITYVRTDEGWLYLAAILDACSRRVVGWSLADHLRTELALAALDMALDRRRPAPGLLHHSDRGTQYLAHAYTTRLTEQQVRRGVGRPGACWDNAVAESFFATLKTELLHRHTRRTRQQARTAIFEYIEAFYNRQRRHSTLGYLSPAEFEDRYHRQATAA